MEADIEVTLRDSLPGDARQPRQWHQLEVLVTLTSSVSLRVTQRSDGPAGQAAEGTTRSPIGHGGR